MAHPMRKHIKRDIVLTKRARTVELQFGSSMLALATFATPAMAHAADNASDSVSPVMAANSQVDVQSPSAESAAQKAAIAAENKAREQFELQFRVDSLVLNPVLNAGLLGTERTVVAGMDAQFLTYNNYPAATAGGEVRIFAAGKSPTSEPIATISVDQDGAATWHVPEDAPGALYFVYRANGSAGQFDETHPQELTVVSKQVSRSMEAGPMPTRPDFGVVDQAAVRNIALKGMMATVTGHANPTDDLVRVNGQLVPIDINGRFVAQQIVPRDQAAMDVIIARDGEQVAQVRQDFGTTPLKDDWFVVGQGDLTLGKSYSSGPSREVSGDTLAAGSYAIGRAAVYAKGVVGDEWRITAALDTGETLVKDLFSNLDRKDPKQLLRRLNSEQYYPTYGDDSTLVEDAPTQGRFYLRVKKDASQLVVGNFTTQVTGGELAQLDRGLFGAILDLNSNGVTSFGERKAQAIAFASDPGTVPGREEFRGTGGSLYHLKRQDVSVGSERVRVEIRDRETGLVLETYSLNPQQDYDFDPLQGRLTLLRPLASTMATGSTVREGSSTGNVPVLVVRYEYTPQIGSLDGYTVGGHAATWLGDILQLGATAQRDTVEEADQTLIGVNAKLRLAAGTYAKAEYAQTKGPGFDQSNSVDGGLNFTDIRNPGILDISRAWRGEFAMNFAELAKKQGDLGSASAYYEHQDKGFSSAGRLSPAEVERWGMALAMPIGKTAAISANYDTLYSGEAGRSNTGVVDLSNDFRTDAGTVTLKSGLRYEDRVAGLLYNSVQSGMRTDGAVQIGFQPLKENWEVNAFGQLTLDHDVTRSRNNRAGVGAKAQLTERLSFAGEMSGGDGGLGSDLKLNHSLGDGSEAYVGYALFADTTDTGLDSQNLFTRSNRGTLVLGSRHRFSDSISVYGENKVGIGGSAPSTNRSFGLQFDPTERLSLTGSFENGRIDDATTGEFKRTAASVGVGYTAEDIRLGATVEMRHDNGLGQDQTVWLLRTNASYALNPDWRAIAQFNLARADTGSPSIQAAEYTDLTGGFAYRPVNNERLNALLRFQYFQDLAPVGQISGSGQTQTPKQSSTIVSLDVNYDLSQHVTLAAKYGYRQGKVSLGRESDVFVSSDAHLAVVRLDYNVARKWDVMAEGRALWVTAANDKKYGALGGIYRHLGENVKLGVGYSWSDFSDDLSDQSYTSHGPFMNILATF